MNDLTKKIRDGAIAITIGGGALFAGSQFNRPECTYVLVDNEKEICMTEEQGQAVLDNLKGSNTGFGSSQFQGVNIKKK